VKVVPERRSGRVESLGENFQWGSIKGSGNFIPSPFLRKTGKNNQQKISQTFSILISASLCESKNFAVDKRLLLQEEQQRLTDCRLEESIYVESLTKDSNAFGVEFEGRLGVEVN